jgi:hypothetical protein
MIDGPPISELQGTSVGDRIIRDMFGVYPLIRVFLIVIHSRSIAEDGKNTGNKSVLGKISVLYSCRPETMAGIATFL